MTIRTPIDEFQNKLLGTILRVVLLFAGRDSVRDKGEKEKLMVFQASVRRSLVCVVLGLGFALPPVTPAAAFSKKVERSCLADYKNLCPQYRPNSPQLRACMEGKANEISWGCIEALIDSGEVDKKAARRRS